MKTIIILLLTLFTSAYAVDEKKWVINKNHSEILFVVSYLGVSEVTGSFQSFEGFVDFATNKISLSINAASISSGNGMRDGHLKSNDFLQAKEFPLILFDSNKVTSIGNNKYQAVGELVIKDKKKKITIDYTLTDEVKDTWEKDNRFVNFNFKINRKDFELTWNKPLRNNQFLVGDTVEIKGVFQLQPINALTASSKHMIPTTKYIEMRDKLRLGEIDQKTFNEFKKIEIAEPTVSEPPITDEEAAAATTEDSNLMTALNVVRTPIWMLWFLVLSFFGFIGSILAMFKVKEIFFNKIVRYEEGNKWGVVSDLPTVVVGMIYAMAVWHVGWG
ncbi:MAG: YceI family protein [Bacteriovoracaceae bacterium]|nr:YceI family protein [Bacteriovoracaceae bacterium]